MNDGHPSGGQSTTPSSTPPINNGQKPVALSSQPDPAQAGAQAVQPQMQQSQMIQPQTMNSMQFQPQEVLSGTDDIVLDGSEQKKSKKRLVVGIVIALLVLMGVGVGAVFLASRSDNSSVKNQDERRISSFDAYKHYANFLVYGTKNDEDISDDVLWERQNVIKDVMTFYSLEERLSYADTLQGLYDDFSKLFGEMESVKEYGEDSDLVKDLYENVGSGVGSLSQYIRNGDVLSSSIARTYLDSGSDGVLDLLNAAYGDMENLGDSIYDRFVAAKRSEAEAMILLYDYYSGIGCIADGSLDELCVESYSRDDLAVSLINDVDAAVNESNLLKYQMISDTISSSSELYSILRGSANA